MPNLDRYPDFSLGFFRISSRGPIPSGFRRIERVEPDLPSRWPLGLVVAWLMTALGIKHDDLFVRGELGRAPDPMIEVDFDLACGVVAMAETNPTQSLLPTSAHDAWSITLEVTAGPHAGQAFSFAQHDTFLVGRSTQAHFCLPEKDPFFSRLHFLIEVNPPMCRLVDLKSHNGTLVNGQKVSSIDLQDGDEIRGGTTTLLVQIRAAAREEGVRTH